ncbi:ankyrin repeat domain-containing protein 2-like [Mytilus trossulus]|uniref:ankyrin repeat domain-containing protein 2-like n=1 Tax=Mytilus trossulus TaxID=6551 RepID=UPI003004857C
MTICPYTSLTNNRTTPSHEDLMQDLNKKLHTAARNGDIEALKSSLQNGADIDYQTDFGETALMWAAVGGHLEITRLLLNSRCRTDITTKNGYTALHLAAMIGNLHTTRCLVEQGGISPLIKSHEQVSSLVMFGQSSFLQLILVVVTDCLTLTS